MRYRKTKQEFLDMVAQLKQPDYVDIIKELFIKTFTNIPAIGDLEMYKKIYKRNINISNSRESKEINTDEILQVIKTVYDYWYDYLASLDKDEIKDTETKQDLIKFLNNKDLEKSKMEPRDCAYFLFAKKQKDYPHLAMPILAQHNFEKKKFVFTDENGRVPLRDFHFIHVFPFGKPTINIGTETKPEFEEKIECRLYLNLNPDHISELAKLLIAKAAEKKVKIYYKYFSPANMRNDNFVIYTNYDLAQKTVDLIREIKDERPELFEGTEKTSGLLPLIDGYIGFAEEPVYMHTSYNSELGHAIEDFIENLIKKYAKDISTLKVITSTKEKLNMRDYLKYKLDEIYSRAISNDLLRMEKGDFSFSNGFHNETIKAKYKEFAEKVCDSNSKNRPKVYDDIISERADVNFKYLEQGVMLGGCFTTIYPLKEEETGLSRLNISYNFAEKFFRIFKMEDWVERDITMAALKPFFEKYHLSGHTPYLNIESVENETEENKY